MNMKISFATVVSGAIALHASLAYATGSCGVAGEFTDKFDDLRAAGLLTPELAAPVPAPYNGLKYSMVNVNSLTTGNLQLESPPQAIALFITNNVLGGNPVLNPYFTISALPSTTNGARTFDLLDFSFGCVLPLFQSAINVASSCDISVTGIKPNGERSGELSFSFASTAVTGRNAMSRANVRAQALTGDYIGLSSVNITITRAAVDAAVGVLFVDNVRHVNRC